MKFLISLIIISFYGPFVIAQAQPDAIIKKTDLIYKMVANWDGRMDVYHHQSKIKKPLIIYIHGGGWVHGKKENEYDKFSVFLKNGYAVANVEYRLANQAPAPAAIEDVHCAIMYLLKNAVQFNIDPSKIILMGGSAGAHLALLAGLQSTKPIYFGDCKSKKFKVAGIISKYGPTDLLTWKPATTSSGASSAWIGDRLKDTAFIKSLSPTNYVNRKIRNIPVLFIHGDQDKTVPIMQSEMLYNSIKQNGNNTELYIVKNGKHGNFGEAETAKMDLKMLSFVARYVN